MGLKRSKIRSWGDLSEAFLIQYKYNLDMAPTRLQLQNKSQISNETFKEYAQCWREVVSRVQPALSDNELVDLFMGTLQGLYFEKMIGSSSTNFADMVTIGERDESGLKSGKITDTTAQQTTNKRPHWGFAKKNKGGENAVTAKARPRYQFLMAHMPYYPYSYITAAQYQQPTFQYQSQTTETILVIDPKLTREIPAATPPFRAKHDPNASCAYHAGFIRHSTEDCWALKYKIQDLINQDILTFSKEKPNVKTNPLPNYNGAVVNTVIEEENTKFILRAEEVETLMSVVLQKLEQFGFLKGVHDDCAICESNPDNCDKMRSCVQELMDQGLIQFSKSQAAKEVAVIEPITIVYKKKKVEVPPKRIQPIHFRVPTLFPYQNAKAVPWNYETTTYLGGKEIRIPDTEIVNIAGTGGMTRSGRVFDPK
ncbi:uncharacterized protein LOC127137822 [Lathyrus oleraceus]|uniref:uncharacterized protein LOC127137822 n=1 Tax=Pisum sativum TaxID=3888 RepID=UPI0021D2DC96|nr:uncharacterized protein LOC127137822 [Pisum sativum]